MFPPGSAFKMFETKLDVPSKTSEADIWTCLCFLNSRHETPKKETISQKSFNQAITYFFGQCLRPSLVGKVKLVTQDIFLSCVFLAENNMFIDKCFVPRCPKAVQDVLSDSVHNAVATC